MVHMLQRNHQRELNGIKPWRVPLNQLFVGQPGTGKTTVATLYGRVLADMGLFSRGDVVLKTPSDFLGDAVGMSEKQTQRILDATVGKVLVIDPGDTGKEQDKFKSGIIDIIVANVHGAPGENRCIIMLGHEDRIIDMFHNANPGLTRRFNMKRMFKFENYNLSELDQIMTLKIP